MRYILELLVQVVWDTIVGYFLVAGNKPLVYILYVLFSTFISHLMTPTKYNWTVLISIIPFL